jgi:hypothetical protein
MRQSAVLKQHAEKIPVTKVLCIEERRLFEPEGNYALCVILEYLGDRLVLGGYAGIVRGM